MANINTLLTFCLQNVVFFSSVTHSVSICYKLETISIWRVYNPEEQQNNELKKLRKKNIWANC